MRKQLLFIIAIFLFSTPSIFGLTLHLTTENYPPFNMSIDGKGRERNPNRIIGISTDLLKVMMKRAKIGYTLDLYPWARAYNDGLKKRNFGVFSTTHTKERDPLFKWVGPLVYNNWVFLAKNGSKIRIRKLSDAKKYRIGGYRGDATALYLQKQGFRLKLSTADHLNARKLKRGIIDLWATGNLLGPYLAKQEGVKNLKTVYVFKRTVMSLALNKSVPNKVVKRLNQVLKKIKKDGTLKRIQNKYK
ncbi:MAG: polar amino acid transport system substrate-binding protein [bacterium]|jgi:polar amino acid transport system substrate-binding protein